MGKFALLIRQPKKVTLMQSVSRMGWLALSLASVLVLFACDNTKVTEPNAGEDPEKAAASHPMFQFDSSVAQDWRHRFVALVDAERNDNARKFFHFDEGSIRVYTSSAGRTVARLPSERQIILCPHPSCDAGMALNTLLSAALQERLLALRSAENGITIALHEAPAVEQSAACLGREILSAAMDQAQYVPLCWSTEQAGYESFHFYPEIHNSSATDQQLALFYFSANGCVISLSDEGLHVPAGESRNAAAGGSSLPLNRTEYIFALDVRDADVPPAFDSCAENSIAPLRALVNSIENKHDTIAAAREFKAVSNRVLTPAGNGAHPGQPREYTVKDFDIRPYLPDDRDSALYKVLYTAHTLTGSAQRDGIGYAQHDWSMPSDNANLALGIDCSRAIWYSFTRSHLPYTAAQVENADYLNQGYIPTVSMVSESAQLSHHFLRCDDDSPRLGDVLVYRRTDADTGHVVMVIDPEQRIAWGSHGWDGNGRTPDAVPDVGAEYQLIKYKRDWQAWDRRTMTLRACWRYKDFAHISEVDVGNSAPEECDPELTLCVPTI